MSARIVFIILGFLNMVWFFIKYQISYIQRGKTLPAEVSDIYDAERYQTFLNYEAESTRLAAFRRAVLFVVLSIITLSPVYEWIEKFADKNIYIILLITIVMQYTIEEVFELPFFYYGVFTIEEKYGLNKSDKKTFFKDTLVEYFTNLIMSIGLLEIVVFMFNKAQTVSISTTLGYGKAFLVCLAMALGMFILIVIMVVIQIISLRLQYKFTPLEEGDLRNKINHLQESSRKKVKRIYVYDESKKTTSKNAFLLKFLFFREFGIADNFLNENSERELLAVLSHEIGHLKHKKTFLNYLKIIILIIMFMALWYILANPHLLSGRPVFENWIIKSFNLTVYNYYLNLALLTGLFKPLYFLLPLVENYRQRQEEYEADQEAVKNGYGEDLINTFKEMSSDELIDINPHPIMVFLYYDHPTIYQRIVAIREGIIRQQKENPFTVDT